MTAFPRASRSATSTLNSSPGTHCEPSISSIMRSTNGEIASILLGIQESISRTEERESRPEGCDREPDAPFRLCISLLTSWSAEMHQRGQSLEGSEARE